MKKLALFGALAIMMMTSCSALRIVDQNSAINAGAAAIQALTISDAEIAQLCSEYMVESDGQNTVLPADNSYSQRLSRIMAKFHNINGLCTNYKVYQSNTVNAFASGDGSVRVYSALMDAMDDDELFAVIGHELGHLKNKDVRDAYRTAYLIVAARYGIGAFNQTAGAIATGFLGDLGQELASNAYSRKQEYEADEASFQYCVTNGVDPYAMYRALNVLINLNGNSGTHSAVAQMFATHPDSQKRATRIKEMAEAAGYKMGTTGTTTKPKTTTNPKSTNTKPQTVKPNNNNSNSGNNNGNTGAGGKKVKAGKK